MKKVLFGLCAAAVLALSACSMNGTAALPGGTHPTHAHEGQHYVVYHSTSKVDGKTVIGPVIGSGWVDDGTDSTSSHSNFNHALQRNH